MLHRRTRQRYTRNLLAAAIAAAILLASQAQAQPADAEDRELEEVVVQGIAESLKKSRDTKRDADAIVDAISAEDIGKFPDKNVAESLSHLPGVTIDRDFGQGERVSIRGTDPALNRTLLNGQTIASADWFILDSPGRTFNYTLLAPEAVGRLEVYKSPEARIDEGSIGGTVILHTRNPLDLDDPVLNGQVGYAYNDRAEDGAPNASGLVSFKNDAGTAGLIVSLIRSEEQLRRDGIETFSYPNARDAGFPAAIVGDAEAVFPNAINAALFEQERTRTGGSVGLQLRPSDAFEVNLTGLYVKAEYDNHNQSRYAFNGWGPNFTGTPNVTDATVDDGVVTSATFDENALTLLDSIVRKAEVETKALNLRGDWYGDGWQATGQIGSTKADGGTQQQYFLEFEGLGGYTYNIGREEASVDFENDPADPASLPGLGFAQLRQQPTSDEEQYVQGDFSKSLEWGAFNQIQLGLKYREHETGQDARLTGVGGLAGRNLSQFDGGLTPGGFLGGIDANEGLEDWITVDRDAQEDFLGGVPENNAYNAFPEAAFDVAEDITAAYTQLNFGGGPWRGNFGVRYVKTEQTSRGQTRLGNGQLAPVVFEKDYDDWLPSINVAYELDDDVILRAAGSRVLSRPNYADLSSFTVLLDTVLSGNGGNPNLDPYRANNFDFSAEWYVGESGLIAGTVFVKNIASYIINVSAPETQLNAQTGQLATYDITRPRNGAGGETKGFELMYQNTFANGFGIQTNYTYSDGDTDEGLEIPFNSKHAFNVTPYFETDRFSARVTYSWRDKYFRQIGRNGVAVTNDEYAQLDAQIGWKLTENVELTLEGLNLLDETQYQYAGQEDRPLAIYKNGRRYFAGVRFAF